MKNERIHDRLWVDSPGRASAGARNLLIDQDFQSVRCGYSVRLHARQIVTIQENLFAHSPNRPDAPAARERAFGCDPMQLSACAAGAMQSILARPPAGPVHPARCGRSSDAERENLRTLETAQVIVPSGFAPDGCPVLQVFFFAPLFFASFLVSKSTHPLGRHKPRQEKTMRIPEHPTEIRRMLDARRARVAPERPVLAATLTQVRKRCGQPTCRCYHGEPHLA